jgi:hypothetical protein
VALFLQRGDELLPEQTPELILNSSRREVSSLVPCPVAACTCLVDAQVGQEGVGTTHQRQGYHCRSRRALLGLAEPQQRLDGFPPPCDGPTPVIGLEQWGGRAFRGIADAPEALLGRPLAREDALEAA